MFRRLVDSVQLVGNILNEKEEEYARRKVAQMCNIFTETRRYQVVKWKYSKISHFFLKLIMSTRWTYRLLLSRFTNVFQIRSQGWLIVILSSWKSQKNLLTRLVRNWIMPIKRIVMRPNQSKLFVTKVKRTFMASKKHTVMQLLNI